MKNYIARGDTIPFTAASDVSSGRGVLVGTLVGIAAGDVASGAVGEAKTTGVFSHAKAASQAWTVGAKVYWDNTNFVFTTTAASNTLAGIAYEAVAGGAGDTTGKVRLNGTA